MARRGPAAVGRRPLDRPRARAGSAAAQSDEVRRYLARRYQAAWDGVDAVATAWAEPNPDVRVGPAVIGLLLGLEMMRRIDPTAVTDETAIAALRSVVVGASDRTASR